MAKYLTEQILDALQMYKAEVIAGVKKAVDQTAKATAAEVLKHITFRQRTSKYVASFTIRKKFENDYMKVVSWCASGGQHRLTHLLEFGHRSRSGGRVRAFPHVKYGEEIARSMLPELIQQVIEKAI